MKYVDEYRNSAVAQKYSHSLHKITKHEWRLMEICGGQTHNIIKFGVDRLLPEGITLLHGPGCPVCVTPIEVIDKSIEIASTKNVIFVSFGDMLRVPGSSKTLFVAKSKGADVRVVYSPMNALEIARENPEKEVVFFAIGFETTAPANAMAVYQAKKLGLSNFSVLVSHMLVPPALEAILSSPNNRVQGFLAAGHVCTVAGYREYEPLSEKFSIPVVVCGFEPLDLLQGILMCVKQLEEGKAFVENQYSRSVRREGNTKAQELIREVFSVIPREWRGIGEIPVSGLTLSPKYGEFDAEKKFGHVVYSDSGRKDGECISGQILTGEKKPSECPAFGSSCTPIHPLGATMVSSEGACAAYFQYRFQSKNGARK